MSVTAIGLVKDEVDIIRETVSRMVEQVDRVVVADNGSTDGTRDVLEEFVGPDFEVRDDTDPAHYQSRKMSALAADAAADGASWVVPFDADEVWRSSRGRVADVLAELGSVIATAPIVHHVSTAKDPLLGPVERMGWRQRKPLGLHKVACRPALPVLIHEGNHNASYPKGVTEGALEVRHFPYRSADQFLSKVRNGAAALKATDLGEDVGVHWRQYGELLEAEGPDAVRDWFRKHFHTLEPETDSDLTFDPCP